MRVWLVLLVGVLMSACSSAPKPETRVRLRGDSLLVFHFRQAERRYEVPAEVLAAVSYALTRLSSPPAGDDRHGHGEAGVMAIGSAGLTSAEVAAALTGLTPERVAHEPEANIFGAAALLREAARARGQGRSREPSEWWAAVEAYGGPLLSDEVRRWLGHGFSGTDDAGKSVVLEVEVATSSEELGYPKSLWSPAYSGNYKAASRTAADIDYIVIHTTEGSYSGAISWFKDPSAKVSAHYVVRSSDGQITQMVDDTDIAWHDGCFNTNTLGIEHEAISSQPSKWFTTAMYQSSAALAAWLCDQYTIPKDRKHIMGHGEAPDCSTHTDPGSGWDWDYYMDLVTGSTGSGGTGGAGGTGGTGGSSGTAGSGGGTAGTAGSGGSGGGTPPPSPGVLESASCDALVGWARDVATPGPSVKVELDFDQPSSGATAGSFSANLYRDDLCQKLGWCDHGFSVLPPYSLFDGVPHSVFAYGNNAAGTNKYELDESPKQLLCQPPVVAGVKRSVSPAAQSAWKLDLFWDEAPSNDATIDALTTAGDLPDALALIRSDDGSEQVWLLDGELRRAVPSLSAWHFSAESVQTRAAAELQALAEGPPLRQRPMLVRSSNGHVFLVDDSEGDTGALPDGPEPSEDGSLPKLGPSASEGSARSACAASIAGRSAPPGSSLVLLLGALTWRLARRRFRSSRSP